MTQSSIRSARPDDVQRIKQIAVAAEMFDLDEVGFFDEMLGGHFDGTLDGHRWLVVEGPGHRVWAAANYAPEPFADRLWNLYFIAVDPEHQGRGVGRALMTHAESELRALGERAARVVIVETSSTDQYSRTRDFYRTIGYDEEARVRDFYGPGDHKVTFWKSLLD